ncbi:MAG: Gldg family protein [Spirochaetales bacterium]|nr:Gldg family protein [Spirochaetales bacterium]
MPENRFLTLFNSKRTTLVLTAILVILINILAASLLLKLDLTSSRAYTLLDISKDTISEIQNPLSAKVFFTSDLPAQYNDIEPYVRDLLKEYVRAANGNFSYEFYDMEKQENKELASNYGVLPLEIHEFKNDRQEQRIAYMGIALVYGNMIERIDGLASTAGVEYMITTTIKKMISKQNVLAGLEEKGKVVYYKSSAFASLGIQDFENSDQIIRSAFNKLNEELSGALEFEVVNPAPEQVQELAAQYGMRAYAYDETKNAAGEVIDRKLGLLSLLISIDGKSATVDPLARSIFGSVGFQKSDAIYEKLNTSLEGLVSANPKVAYLMGHYENDVNDRQSGNGALYINDIAGKLYDLDIVMLNSLMASGPEGEAPEDPEAYEIPDNIRTLIINSPKMKIPEEDLFKIDQFLMRGGSLLILADAFQQQQLGPDYPPIFRPIDNGLGDWLKKKGLAVNADLVLDQNSIKDQSANARNGRMPQYYYIPYIDKETMNSHNAITANLNRFLTAFPSSISIDEDIVKNSDFSVSSLFSSSPHSWTMEGQINLNNIYPQPEDMMKQYTLAVLAEGNFDSYFSAVPEGLSDNPLWKDRKVIPKSINEGKILLVGSSQVFSDMILSAAQQVLRTQEQQYLLQNMIDYLNGNADSAFLRTKGRGINTLRESKDATRTFLRVFNIGIVPVLVILAGLLVWFRRAARRKKLKSIYGNGGSDE